jgi:hypothetical protein
MSHLFQSRCISLTENPQGGWVMQSDESSDCITVSETELETRIEALALEGWILVAKINEKPRCGYRQSRDLYFRREIIR